MFTGRNRDSFNKKIKFMLVFLLAFKFFLRLTADNGICCKKSVPKIDFVDISTCVRSFLKQDENFNKSCYDVAFAYLKTREKWRKI
jgi:hypothetical protein